MCMPHMRQCSPFALSYGLVRTTVACSRYYRFLMITRHMLQHVSFHSEITLLHLSWLRLSLFLPSPGDLFPLDLLAQRWGGHKVSAKTCCYSTGSTRLTVHFEETFHYILQINSYTFDVLVLVLPQRGLLYMLTTPWSHLQSCPHTPHASYVINKTYDMLDANACSSLMFTYDSGITPDSHSLSFPSIFAFSVCGGKCIVQLRVVLEQGF